jgi:hypothetical protein
MLMVTGSFEVLDAFLEIIDVVDASLDKVSAQRAQGKVGVGDDEPVELQVYASPGPGKPGS